MVSNDFQMSHKMIGRIAVLVAVAIVFVVFERGTFSSLEAPSIPGADNIWDVKNETLGFQKVVVLALPERTDRRDAISLTSSLSGFKIEWEDAVRGETISDKAKPAGWDDNIKPSALGCWRGHMNIAQRMINERIQSTLVLEDDADWDVMLKAQLVEFARGSRYIQGATGQTHSPYGDDWDILWLGHCGAINRMFEDHKCYVIPNDPTVVPPQHRIYPSRRPNYSPLAMHGNHTRLVFSPQRSLCTASYAISLRGAHKLLYNQAMTPQGTFIDKALSHMCVHESVAKCVAPYPAIIGVHRGAGNASKDSDIESSKKAVIRKVGMTEFIAHPMRLNVDRFLAGERTFKSQWPNDTMLAEVELTTEMAKGSPEFFTKDQFSEDF